MEETGSVLLIYIFKGEIKMDENMNKVATMLANDAISVKAYETFLNATDRLRYFGYVDKKELKQLCRRFNYTDGRSFIKGGITALAIIGLIKLYRKAKESEQIEEQVKEVEVDESV
jgi:hypothetical protein